jgi:hypothetical protein
MISSPSAQIVNALSESNFVTSYTGKKVEAYGPVMGIATAIIALGIAVTAALGPEKRGRSFEVPPAGMALRPAKDIETGDEDYDRDSKHDVEHVEVMGSKH